MERKNCCWLRIIRVFQAYTKPLFLGFVLGVALVFGSVLVNQVVGNEIKPIIQAQANEVEEEESGQLTEQIQQQTSSSEEATVDNENDSVGEIIPTFEQKVFTILLVGLDRRPGETTLSNTDSLLVASINTETGRFAFISIPRDTQVTIPNHGKNKINAAARLGKGLKTTETLIEDLIGQPIDGYVLTNFSGFKTIIDTLGGITLTVEKDMYYVTGDEVDGIIDLKKGTQHLNGSQALQYARFRNDAFADISRTARQQAVLKAVGKEFLQVKTLAKLPWLIPQMSQAVETNLTVSQLWSLTNVMVRNEKPEILAQTLPGNFLTENDISYWKVQPMESRAVVKRVLEQGKTSSVFFK